MQEFFMDYGLWLLIALLIVIGLVFLLGRRRKVDESGSAETHDMPEPKRAAATVPDPVVPVPSEPFAAPPAAPGTTSAPDLASVTPAAADAGGAASARMAEPVAEQGDNLLKLKGIGPKLNLLLIELGVTRYAQIAEWSDADIAAIDARLGSFKGRPVRDQWVDQARYLAAGDTAGFEAKYGKL